MNCAEFLELHKLQWGSFIEIELRNGAQVRGYVVPPYASTDLPDHIAIQMPDGYCTGVILDAVVSVQELGYKAIAWSHITHPSSFLASPKPITPDLQIETDALNVHYSSEVQQLTTQKSTLQTKHRDTDSLAAVLFASSAPDLHTPQCDVSVMVCCDIPERGQQLERLISHHLATRQIANISLIKDRQPQVGTDPIHPNSHTLQNHSSDIHRSKISCSVSWIDNNGVLDANFWSQLATKVFAEIESGVRGIVVVCPRDSVLDAAVALAFMLQNLTIPIIFLPLDPPERFVWSRFQRDLYISISADAQAEFAEIVICVPADFREQRYLLLRATRSMPCHATRRTAFHAPYQTPIAIFEQNKLTIQRSDITPRNTQGKPSLVSGFDTQIALITAHPAASPLLCNLLSSVIKAAIIALPSQGEVPRSWLEPLQKLAEKGIMLYAVSLAANGHAQLSAFVRGRELVGLRQLPPILPEIALIKLGWAIAQSSTHSEIDQLMQSNIAGEVALRETLIF
jgi:L-asparaginase/Glu-tRNA(Gln) amidotransferase subunit D